MLRWWLGWLMWIRVLLFRKTSWIWRAGLRTWGSGSEKIAPGVEVHYEGAWCRCYRPR